MRPFLICGLLLLLGHSLWSQYFPVLDYQKFYGKGGDDVPKAMYRTPDGFLILGGNSEVRNPDGSAHRNVWVMKLDTLGDIYWERELFLPGEQELRDLESAYDGGVVFAGVSAPQEHPERGSEAFAGDFFMGKIDSLGQLAWTRTYGGHQLDQAFSLARGPYREYLLAGSAHSRNGDLSENYGMSDIWLLKVDTRGKQRMSKSLGGTRADWASSIVACRNGDYALAGFSNSPELANPPLGVLGNGVVMRLAQSGRTLWKRTFACPQGGYFTQLIEDQQGRLVLAGRIRKPGMQQQFWFMKLSAEGEVLTERVFGSQGDDYLTSLAPCQDGGYLLGGYSTYSPDNPLAKGGEDFMLIRVDSLGEVIWRQSYGGPDQERCRAVMEYRPGVVYALGEKVNDFSESQGKRGKDYWLLRIKEMPCDSLQSEIFVRAPNFETQRDFRTRFKALHRYARSFSWDFGDGSQSDEQNPLKAYSLPGTYPISLTIQNNESCTKTIRMKEQLKVK